MEAKKKAKAICAQYEASVLGFRTDSEAQTAMAAELRVKTKAYVSLWPNALPLRGIIINHEGDHRPKMAETMVNEMLLACPGVDEASLWEAIRDCWKLVDRGVLSVHTLPYGPVSKSTPAPRNKVALDTYQVEKLAETLAQLVCLSSKMRGSDEVINVVALGKWAQLLAQKIELYVATQAELPNTSSCRLLHVRNLNHPGYTWHMHKQAKMTEATMGNKSDLYTLYQLFTAPSRLASTPNSICPPSPHRSAALEGQQCVKATVEKKGRSEVAESSAIYAQDPTPINHASISGSSSSNGHTGDRTGSRIIQKKKTGKATVKEEGRSKKEAAQDATPKAEEKISKATVNEEGRFQKADAADAQNTTQEAEKKIGKATTKGEERSEKAESNAQNATLEVQKKLGRVSLKEERSKKAERSTTDAHNSTLTAQENDGATLKEERRAESEEQSPEGKISDVLDLFSKIFAPNSL